MKISVIREKNRFNPCFLGSCSPRGTCLGWAAMTLGFNPCFLGSCSPSSSPIGGVYVETSVSILVFLDLALRGSAHALKLLHILFQSLFSWILLSEDHDTLFDIVHRKSFNPCFLGSCSPRMAAERLDASLREFQSLFSWILLSEHEVCGSILSWQSVSILVFLDLALRAHFSYRPDQEGKSFNPCFLGSCSPSTGSWDFSLLPPKFQSLFSWILLSECGNPPTNLWGALAVSILVFLDLALRVYRIWGFSDHILIVSILVFLDLALRVRESPDELVRSLSCFNPCFLGSCSPRIGPYDPGLSTGEFQSLFSWILLSEYIGSGASRIISS